MIIIASCAWRVGLKESNAPNAVPASQWLSLRSVMSMSSILQWSLLLILRRRLLQMFHRLLHVYNNYHHRQRNYHDTN